MKERKLDFLADHINNTYCPFGKQCVIEIKNDKGELIDHDSCALYIANKDGNSGYCSFKLLAINSEFIQERLDEISSGMP